MQLGGGGTQVVRVSTAACPAMANVTTPCTTQPCDLNYNTSATLLAEPVEHSCEAGETFCRDGSSDAIRACADLALASATTSQHPTRVPNHHVLHRIEDRSSMEDDCEGL